MTKNCEHKNRNKENLPGIMLPMKYFDKNGSQWSIDKGDWVGSFNKDEQKILVVFLLRKFSLPLLIILILSVILLNWV